MKQLDLWLPLVLDAAARGAVVLAAAAVLCVMLRKRSAATRHAIWTVALLAQLAIPALVIFLPDWRVTVAGLPAWLSRESRTAATAGTADRALALEVSALDARRARLGQRLSLPDVELVAGAEAVARQRALADRSRASSGDRVSAGRDLGRSSVERGPVSTSAGAGGPPQQHVSTNDGVERDRSNAPLTRSTQAASPTSDLPLLAVLWIIGAVAVVVRYAVGTFMVSRLARSGERVDDGGWLSLTQRLAVSLGIRRPLTLLRGDRLAVPVTWGVVYPVVLLPEDADAWPEERRRYVLLHEMAHVKRLDALTQLVAQITVALFWFNPLIWLAARRMRAEREHACDDYVLRHGTTASTYASDLLQMVRSLASPEHRQAQPAFAALAMARRSEFEGRMLSILDPHQDRHPLRRGGTFAIAVLALLFILPLAAFAPTRSVTPASVAPPAPIVIAPAAAAPVVVFPTASPRRPAPSLTKQGAQPGIASTTVQQTDAVTKPDYGDLPDESQCRVGSTGGRYSVHSHIDDKTGEYLQSLLLATPGRCIRAGFKGRPLFTADEKDVHASPGGEIRIADRVRRGELHELRIRSEGTNAQSRTYLVDGEERPDADARTWLASLIPQLLRESGIDADLRVARLQRAGGTTAVLAEIAQLRSDGVKRKYYEALLSSPGLSASDADRVLRQAGRDVKSDGDLRGILDRASRQRSRSGAQFDAESIGAAVRHMTSDGDITAVLLKFALEGDRSMLLMAMREAARVTSDGDKARLMVRTAPRYLAGEDSALHHVYFRTAKTITSDGDLANVLLAAIPHTRPSCAVTTGVISASHHISSDGDRANVLLALARRRVLDTKSVRAKFLEAAKGITSDGDYRRVIEALP